MRSSEVGHRPTDGSISLFDGSTLDGWYAVPRTYGPMWPGGPTVDEVIDLPADYATNAAAHPAVWSVVDGAIEGRQDPARPGYGGYLVSEQTFGDFELELEMNPDWPADTGIMLRRRAGEDWAGFQVLVDHRKSGSIGGFYGNGIGGFHAVPFVLDASTDEDGQPNGLIEEDPSTSLEPMAADKIRLLSRAGDVQAFLDSWRWADWNHLRITCRRSAAGDHHLGQRAPGRRTRHSDHRPSAFRPRSRRRVARSDRAHRVRSARQRPDDG